MTPDLHGRKSRQAHGLHPVQMTADRVVTASHLKVAGP